MSEYLSKKAVLEWLDDRRYKSPWIESFRDRLESGAFDVDQTEVQRLRAVLEQARRNLLANAPKTALGHIEEALSTTTVQAERVKPFQQRLVALTIEENKRIYKDGINAPEGDGNDA